MSSNRRTGRARRRLHGSSWAAAAATVTLVCGLTGPGVASANDGHGRGSQPGAWSDGRFSGQSGERMLGHRLANPRHAFSARQVKAAAGSPTDPIDLRVLVLATTGDPNPDGVHATPAGSWDWNLSTVTGAMDFAGVPYDTYKSTTKQLCVGGTWKLDWAANPTATVSTCSSNKVVSWATGVLPANLWDGGVHAYYEGVVQTSGTLSYVDGTGAFIASALSSDEWTALWTFEAKFGIRTVSEETYPSADFGLTYTGEDGNATTATYTAAAQSVFPYLNTTGSLPIANAYTYRGTADPNDANTSVLMTDAANDALAVVHTYPDQGNRQALALTFDSAGYLEHGQVLGYGLVNWVTKGLFLGSRHAYLDPQPDDLFIADSIWQGPGDAKPTVCGTRPDDPSLPESRITGSDITALVNWQNATHASPISSQLKIEFPFNGEGTTSAYYRSLGITTDTLVPAVKANQANFKFINHTYDHQNLDGRNVTVTVVKSGTVTKLVGTNAQFANSWGHTVIASGVPSGTVVSSVSADGNTVTLSKSTSLVAGVRTVWMGVTYSQAGTEISQNATIGSQLGLKAISGQNLVQPDISGLTNQDFLQAAYDKGVRYLISDTSLTGDPHTYGANEGAINSGTFNRFAPGATFFSGNAWNIYTIARTPVNLYYNVNSPSRWLAEDQCLYPAGVFGHVDTYQQLLDRVSNQLLGYLLQGQNRPLMFHQPNVATYDGTHSLFSDLMDMTLAKYKALVNVPIVSPTMDKLGQAQSSKMTYDAALRAGKITASTVPGVSVTLTNTSTGSVQIPVTGVNGGTAYSAETYAGQSISYVTLAAGASATLAL
jgi:hypothetical protein